MCISLMEIGLRQSWQSHTLIPKKVFICLLLVLYQYLINNTCEKSEKNIQFYIYNMPKFNEIEYQFLKKL